MMESKLNNLAEWSVENPHYDDEFIIKAILNVAKEFWVFPTLLAGRCYSRGSLR
jgi:hypothetical protein